MKVQEFNDSIKMFSNKYDEQQRDVACRNPLEGHDITKEYRAKMADWMIEVTTSFQCSPKTYFLSLTILDKYLIAQHQQGVTLGNGDIHRIGMISMYLASKMDDVFPLHSKIVSEKIAHGTMTP